MKTIWKFPLLITDEQPLLLPSDHEFLSVQIQDDTITLWAIVDPATPARFIRVRIYGTGNPMPDMAGFAYLGTVPMPLPFDLVWHVFVEGQTITDKAVDKAVDIAIANARARG